MHAPIGIGQSDSDEVRGEGQYEVSLAFPSDAPAAGLAVAAQELVGPRQLRTDGGAGPAGLLELATQLAATRALRLGDRRGLPRTGLGAAHGTVVTLKAEGDGADAALAELKGLIETDLDAQ